MKNLYCLLLIFCSLVLNAQWVVLDSINYGNHQCIEFLNRDTGFVYNEPGILRKTMDGGVVWDTIAIPFGGYLFDIEFGSKQVIYAAGGSYFPSGRNYGNALLRTSDGGANWDSLYGVYNNGIFSQIESISEDEFYVAGNGVLIHSDDGGQSLDTIVVTTDINETLVKVLALSPSNLFVLGLKYLQAGQRQITLYESIDGGSNWNSIFTDISNTYGLDFEMSPDGKMWLSHNSGSLEYSTDSGFTWQKLSLAQPGLFLSKISYMSGYMYAVGVDSTENGLYISTDNGFTWQKQIGFSLGKYIVDMDFPTPQVGYFLTNREIYKNDQLISTTPLEQRSQISFYPNPVKDFLKVEVPSTAALQLNVYDFQRKKLYSKAFSGKLKYRIDLQLEPGIYMMEWQQSGNRNFSRILKL